MLPTQRKVKERTTRFDIKNSTTSLELQFELKYTSHYKQNQKEIKIWLYCISFNIGPDEHGLQGTEHLEKFTVEEKEKEKLEKSLAEREEANGKLKELLKSEQSSAEKLRTEIRRLVSCCSTHLRFTGTEFFDQRDGWLFS